MNDMIADRIKGCLFGQAIGDALGLGTEFMSQKDIQNYYPNGFTDYRQMIDDHHRNKWVPGEWTDDTDMMLCITDAMIEDKGINPMTVAGNFHRWYEGTPLGIGRNTRNVLRQHDYLANPFNASMRVWEATGKANAANGGLMRTAPVGLLNENVPQNAEAICKLTHADPRCIGSCVIQSVIINRLVWAGVAPSFEEIKALGRQYDERIDAYLELAKGDLAGLELDNSQAMGYTLKTLGASLWTLFHAKDFASGLLAIVNAGGDADTNGAVAASLLGAKFGFKAIPAKYVDGLVRKDRMADVAEKMIRLLA